MLQAPQTKTLGRRTVWSNGLGNEWEVARIRCSGCAGRDPEKGEKEKNEGVGTEEEPNPSNRLDTAWFSPLALPRRSFFLKDVPGLCQNPVLAQRVRGSA